MLGRKTMMTVQEKLQHAISLVESGDLIPYLGPGVTALSGPAVPDSPQALAALIEAQVRVPKRAAGNMWAAAQYVESRKFRATLNEIIAKAFDAEVTPNLVHDWLARVRPPMIVDAWYDDGLISAFHGTEADWGWEQGVSRNGEWIEIWTRAYDHLGHECAEGSDKDWKTLIYKPHGLARKGSSFLMSDSDYVEVLTEIDIQTPIPMEVKQRRTTRGFLFLGCRFDDQLLRIFARQIMKRSAGPNFALIEGPLTRMEQRFLDDHQIERLDLPLSEVISAIAAPA